MVLVVQPYPALCWHKHPIAVLLLSVLLVYL